MHNTFRIRFGFSCSENLKWLGLSLIAFVFVVTGAVAQGQQAKKVPRIGYLALAGPDQQQPSREAFRQGLRDLGYIEGKNILLEFRYAEGNQNRIPSLVAELVQLRVDVLLSTGPGAIRAAKQTTQTIPIVMVITADPVATGLVDSLARPGGNVTGLTTLTRDLSGKRLELLKEAIPTISRVGILAAAPAAGPLKDYEAAARALKIQLQSVEVRTPNPDFEATLQAAAKARVSALILVRTATTSLVGNRKQIADLAIKNRLPLMSEGSDLVEAGALVSYAANNNESFRRAAYYVDKILKGTKPADLPVEQPMKFELVINLKAAKQIGLTIPPNVLARADKVIR